MLATTPEETTSALAVAKRLTHGTSAGIVLVPPWLLPLTGGRLPTQPERDAIVDEHQARAQRLGVRIAILFCICRQWDDIGQLTGRSLLLIVGGKHDALVLQEVTFTSEYRFADRFLFRGELRTDWSNELFFPGRGGVDDLRRHQNSLLLGGVWVIRNKSGPW